MKWTSEQDVALREVAEWIRNPGAKQVFRLFGFAGTGKTTMAKHLCEAVDGTTIFCAYTGKASLVLRQKGCPNPTTIHKLIYIPKDKSKARAAQLEAEIAGIKTNGVGSYAVKGEAGRYEDEEAVQAAAKLAGADYYRLGPEHLDRLRDALSAERINLKRPAFSVNEESEAKDAALIVVDECSMVGERVGRDLESFGIPILVLGDPAQLPPVADEGYFVKEVPDILLTDIQRQAKDNPILWMATQTRNREPLPVGTYGNSRVIWKKDLHQEIATEADQILVGKNITRHNYNARMRQLGGVDTSLDPVKGDKVVCLRNDHEVGILNGAIYTCQGIRSENSYDPTFAMTIQEDDSNRTLDVPKVHRPIFHGDEIPYWDRKEAAEFDFGYAITVHKSQGSQWGKLLLINESKSFREDWWRWLYTGLTRAAEEITVVKV